jgi:nitroimidazol reductase NimA-like FMN-containing flavoprotein (pyridoxamine 5'-phosphate oxidase superfamily)
MKNRQKFSKMLAQRSRRQKKLWFLTDTDRVESEVATLQSLTAFSCVILRGGYAGLKARLKKGEGSEKVKNFKGVEWAACKFTPWSDGLIPWSA